jgi:cyclopropane fatty-acyl-phospholipid synthase-like methyltransferase
MAFRDQLLGTKRGYGWFRQLIRADRAMSTVVRDHIHPSAGQTVLDLGCGPGDMARLLPAGVRYIGVDHNASYLSSTSVVRVDESPVFINADLAELQQLDIGHFDLAIAIGVLHHLDDETARSAIGWVRDRIATDGRFISVDPVFHPEQRSSARVMMALDRGRFVRHPADYERLVRSSFDGVDVAIRHDLLPVPYTHIILDATI